MPGLCTVHTVWFRGWALRCQLPSFYPYIEGVSHNPFEQFDSEENKKRYEAEQKQRALERAIRKSKRKCEGLKTAVDNADEATRPAMQEAYGKAAAKLRQQNAEYKQFCEDNGLKTRQDRVSIAGWDRKQAAQARAAENARNKELANSNHNAINETEIVIGKSLGAKSKNYDIELPNGEIVHLTEGTRVTNIEVIAGKGRNREIDELPVLIMKYPGSNETEWQKKKGIGFVDYNGESYKSRLHWYEEPSVGKVKWKVKPDADGNWFIDDD